MALWAGTGRPAATERSGFPLQGAPEILIRRAGVPHMEPHGLAHLDLVAHGHRPRLR
jgi:hypothetical protein